ncbi:hypothetical protein HCN51_50980 [Nonomuraea sp. FMUSA5-5]|uniref:Uncharacterized protein n=1 Tax=Nonomuraea composti TaxID=2720023 RepID=A0ABX1BM46_9ACTN|nr:hypothetical protein [Nonomuraea sp. FMUSA5-5]NJP97664.1 hypothetical protein [Nonomuraea sp. FMUSA5-5]
MAATASVKSPVPASNGAPPPVAAGRFEPGPGGAARSEPLLGMTDELRRSFLARVRARHAAAYLALDDLIVAAGERGRGSGSG